MLKKIIKNRSTILKSSIGVFLIFIASCNSNTKIENGEENDLLGKKMSFTVEPAPEWTQVFKRDSGWFGGDGIFAVPYSGMDTNKSSDSILFLFSDTMIGKISDGKLEPGYAMVNNSYAMYSKEKDPQTTEFYLSKDDQGAFNAFFKPKTDNGEYYWLGDGFVNAQGNGNLYLFAYRIKNTDGDDLLPFEEVGNDLLVIENKKGFPLKADKQLKIPFFRSEEAAQISFGVGVYTEKVKDISYVYIYGVRGKDKELVVARTTAANIENFNSWEFRSQNAWSKKRNELQTLTTSVSNELSVSKLANGQYALVYQEGGIYPKIYLRLANTPYGPFGEKQLIWDTTTDINDPDLFTYNAKAHPAISKKGELLVSYNVNSFKFFDIIENKPQLYRPRFIKLKFTYTE